MGERRQIARRPGRALRRNDGQHARLRHFLDRLDDLPADARGAARQAADLERHDEPHHGSGERRPHARGVRQDEIALQDHQVVPLDALPDQLAEPGVDAVDGLVGLRDPGNRGGRLVRGRLGGRIEREIRATVNSPPGPEPHDAWLDNDGIAHWPLQIRSRSGLNAMR